MPLKKSPLAPETAPELLPVAGCRIATAAARIAYKNREDVCLMSFDRGSRIAGVLTRSLTASAPVDWCRKRLPAGRARAILVNAGNANAFTGSAGVSSVAVSVKETAKALGIKPNQVFVASTGVIGQPLPDAKIVAHLEDLSKSGKEDNWHAGAAAIMTTDTFAKGASRRCRIGKTAVTITGIAKGSGMIAPDMATMLAFVATDARLPAPVLQKLLKAGTERSFNAITVDGDTSTSDTLLLVATGASGSKAVTDAADPALKEFKAALFDLLIDLAQQVVRDGEGARKFITIEVRGAVSRKAARRIGLAIGNSPLVKTAIAGEDANWGRIVMAVGKSGEKADRDRLAIDIGGYPVARRGQVVADFDEGPVAEHMKGQEIQIGVDIGIGRGRATVWTCDLTHGYIDINADYRS
jgi:glutamate N-acetyltransferase/amino-acid N-acetyltransferase